MVEIMKIMVTSFKMSHAGIAALSAPNPAAGYHWPTPPPETPGHSWANLGQSLVGSLLLSPGSWCAQGFICALQVSVSPVLCKIWQLYDGVNGDLLQEGLCPMPYPHWLHPDPLPLLHSTAVCTEDSQTQFWLSLCGVSEPWCAQGLFEPSKRLWRVRGLILNVISPLLQSCWGFSYALGRGVSFFGGIQRSPIDGCSAVSCNFGVFTGEDEHTSFYSAIFMTSSPLLHGNSMGKQWKQWQTLFFFFFWLQNHCRWWLQPWNLKMLAP